MGRRDSYGGSGTGAVGGGRDSSNRPSGLWADCFGRGLVAYVDPAFRVGVDAADIMDIMIEEYDGSPRMKLTTDRILGDVNNDGQVDAFDALYVLLYSEDSSIALPNNGDISLGDVNGDGQVDLADAVLLATYSVNPSDPTLPPGIGQAAPGFGDFGKRNYWGSGHRLVAYILDGWWGRRR